MDQMQFLNQRNQLGLLEMELRQIQEHLAGWKPVQFTSVPLSSLLVKSKFPGMTPEEAQEVPDFEPEDLMMWESLSNNDAVAVASANTELNRSYGVRNLCEIAFDGGFRAIASKTVVSRTMELVNDLEAYNAAIMRTYSAGHPDAHAPFGSASELVFQRRMPEPIAKELVETIARNVERVKTTLRDLPSAVLCGARPDRPQDFAGSAGPMTGPRMGGHILWAAHVRAAAPLAAV